MLSDGVVGLVVDESAGVGGDIGIVPVESDVPGSADRDGRDMLFVESVHDFDKAGVVDDRPDLSIADLDVVSDIAEAEGLRGVHSVKCVSDVLSVCKTEEIQCGVVGAHLPFVEYEEFREEARFTYCYRLAREVLILGDDRQRIYNGILSASGDRDGQDAAENQQCFPFHRTYHQND